MCSLSLTPLGTCTRTSTNLPWASTWSSYVRLSHVDSNAVSLRDNLLHFTENPRERPEPEQDLGFHQLVRQLAGAAHPLGPTARKRIVEDKAVAEEAEVQAVRRPVESELHLAATGVATSGEESGWRRS